MNVIHAVPTCSFNGDDSLDRALRERTRRLSWCRGERKHVPMTTFAVPQTGDRSPSVTNSPNPDHRVFAKSLDNGLLQVERISSL